MSLFNYTAKEITIKVVYYGPGLSGKTTNLQYLHSVLNPKRKGKLVCLPTEADRTLFFDLLPIDFGKIRDFSIRLQLYTVPGQVRYNATRKLVLKGADAVVFVADSQREMREQNIESIKNMRENLVANNINPDEIPIILQYNKRDLPNILSVDVLNRDLNGNKRYKYIEAIATEGVGVEDSFQRITKLVIDDIKRRQGLEVSPVEDTIHAPEIQDVQVGTGIDEYLKEEFMTSNQMVDSSMYEPFDPTELEEPTYDIPDLEELAKKAIEEEPVIQEEPTIEEEPILKEEPLIHEESVIREEPVIQKGTAGTKEDEKISPFVMERVEMILEHIRDILSMLSEIHDITKKLVEERMEINEQLREIKKKFERLETKKSWFRFK